MNRGDIEIRPAQLSELETLIDFQITMAFESEGMVLDPESVRRGIAGFLARPQDGNYYVIVCDKQLVGCAMIQHEWSDWRAKTVLWLHSVFVDPAFRKRGCFRALYVFLQKLVQDDPELAGIRLYVDKKNNRAEAAYRSLGMSDEHYKLFEWLKT